MPADQEEYAEAVLRVVERVPRGRVTTYGAIADALREQYGGGPRQVGRVMSLHGAAVPWWRVIRADGTLPAGKPDEGRQAWLAEGTPLRRPDVVDMVRAFWQP